MTIWQEDDSNENTHNSGVKEVNLFENNKKLSDPEFSMNPGLYLGMHNMQLYVQENPKLKAALEPKVNVKEIPPMFPWKPYPAIGIYSLYFPNVLKNKIASTFFDFSVFRKR